MEGWRRRDQEKDSFVEEVQREKEEIENNLKQQQEVLLYLQIIFSIDIKLVNCFFKGIQCRAVMWTSNHLLDSFRFKHIFSTGLLQYRGILALFCEK